MSKRPHGWRPGLFAALLALAAQVMFGAVTSDAVVRPAPDQQLAALLSNAGTICHSNAGSSQPTPHRHTVDCAICPLCAAMTAAVMLRDGPLLPAPRAGPVVVATAIATVIILPPPPPSAARPRGPPILA